MFNNYTAVQYLKMKGYREYESENHYIDIMVKLRDQESKAAVVINNNGYVLVGKKNVNRIRNEVSEKLHIPAECVIFIVIDQSEKRYSYKCKNVIILNTNGIYHGTISPKMKEEYVMAKEMYRECKSWEVQTSSAPREQHKPFFTYVVVLINILIYILGTRSMEDAGIYPGIQNQYAEYFRYATYMFMHASLMHLLANILVMMIFGTMLEKKCGTIPTAICYLFSGIYGGILSTCYGGYIGSSSITVGASGAIFGIIGAYSVYQIYSGHSKLRAALLILLSGVISLNPLVDSACHIGGVVGGILYELLFLSMSEMKYAKSYLQSTKSLKKKGKRLNSISNF